MPPESPTTNPLRLALPKGRMQEGVFTLMGEAGIHIRAGARGYRPHVSLPGLDAKILKPQNVLEMLHAGTRDVGFAGADWVRELGTDVVDVLDTGLDTVRLVAAAPASLLVAGKLPDRPIVVASEYARIAADWIASRRLNASFVRSYGATEVFPPEDADCILDITATGDTLRAQNLVIFDELMVSSTRLYANRQSLQDPARRRQIDNLVTLLASVLEARRRVMVEINVSRDAFQRVIEILPCMRGPTVSELHAGAGYAVKAAVPRSKLPLLIPELKTRGASDIIVTQPSQIIP